MKLATYRDGSRDGQLVVVSRDLSSAHYAGGVATRLQQVLDDWNFLSPQLEELSQSLNHGKVRHAFAFDPRQCMAPLPRAYQWAHGSAYPRHGQLLAQTHDDDMPGSRRTDPLMRHGASDDLAGSRDDIVCASTEHSIDFGGGLAVITGDVSMATSAEAAIEGIRLVMLVNDVSLHPSMSSELAEGSGCPRSTAAPAFSPVAATPDELLAAWNGGRVYLNLESVLNGKRVGLLDAGPDMDFHFGALIAHLCKTRSVRAGSIIGSGTVRNQDASRGYAGIAEVRALEAIEYGASKTGFVQIGDTIRIDMKGPDGQTLFGAIEQKVVPRS